MVSEVWGGMRLRRMGSIHAGGDCWKEMHGQPARLPDERSSRYHLGLPTGRNCTLGPHRSYLRPWQSTLIPTESIRTLLHRHGPSNDNSPVV